MTVSDDGEGIVIEPAFDGTDSLQEVTITGKVNMTGAFAGTNLVSVTLDVDSKSDLSFAFMDCRHLTSIDYSLGIYYEGMFMGCTSLTGTLVLDSVNVGERAFSNTGITEIIVSGSSYLEEYAFADCSLLEQVTVLGYVDVGNYAFDGCDTLDSLIVASEENSKPSFGVGVFEDTSLDNVTFHCDLGEEEIRGMLSFYGPETVTVTSSGWISEDLLLSHSYHIDEGTIFVIETF